MRYLVACRQARFLANRQEHEGLHPVADARALLLIPHAQTVFQGAMAQGTMASGPLKHATMANTAQPA